MYNERTTGALQNGAETAVAAVAVQVAAVDINSRKAIILQNTGAANVRIGVLGLTATTGVRLAPGDIVVFEPPFVVNGAIYAIREGGVSSIVLAQEIL